MHDSKLASMLALCRKVWKITKQNDSSALKRRQSLICDRDWKTLCVMATYMDKDGYCFPSQVELAPALGCSRQMVSERVNSLARFRFHGQPVFLVVKGKHTKGGKWARNGYRVLPIANLEIFGRKMKQLKTEPIAQQKMEKITVSRKLDTVKNSKATVSSLTGTVQIDTNYTQYINKNSFSNIRRENNGEKTAIEPIAHVIQQKYPRPVLTSSEDMDIMRSYLADVSKQFNDHAPASSVSRALNLYTKSGLSREAFLARMLEAVSLTKEQASGRRRVIKKPMAFYFAVLTDLLGFTTANG